MPDSVAAPAAAPAPAASAPAPAASPASVAAPAPSSTPAATPAPEAPQGTLRERLAEGWKEAVAKTPEEITEEVATPSTDVPAVEPVVADPVPAEVPAEAVAAPEVPAAAVEEVAPLDLGDAPAFGPKEFHDATQADATLKAYYETHPEQKNAIAAALRRSGDAMKIAQHGIYPENAPTIAKAAATFQSIDNHFLSAANEDGTPNPEGTKAFLNSWIQEAMITGEDGKPLKDAQGKYQLHPAIFSIFDHIYNNKNDVFLQQMQKDGKIPEPMQKMLASTLDFYGNAAKTNGDERLQAAVDILREVSSLSSPASGELPDQLKPFAESLKAERTALDKEKQDAARQRQESATTIHHQSIERAESKAADNAKAQLKPAFDKAGLSKFEGDAAMAEIGSRIDQRLGLKNEDGTWTKGTDERAPLFQAVYDSILHQPASEQREKALTKHILTYTSEILGPIAGEVLRMAKGGALERQTEAQTRVAGQVRTSRTEPHGTSITPSGPQTKSPGQMKEEIKAEYAKTHPGREMPLNELLAEQFKRQTAQPQRI